MVATTKTPCIIVLLFLISLSPVSNAFHCTRVVKPSLLSTSKQDRACLWRGGPGTVGSSTSTTVLTNENAFFFHPRTTSRSSSFSSSSRLFSFQIRSIFHRSSSDKTAATTATGATTTTPRITTTTTNSLKSLISNEATTRATRKLKDVVSSIQSIPNIREKVSIVAASSSEALKQQQQLLRRFLLQYWWSIPSFLALVPLYTTYVLGIGDASMPHWWPVTPMGHILKSNDAAMVLSVFLGSNIAFFVAGWYLIQKFPPLIVQVQPPPPPTSAAAASKSDDSTTSTTTTNVNDGVVVADNNNINAMNLLTDTMMMMHLRRQVLQLQQRLPPLTKMMMIPTRQTWLGILMIASGLISTIFHTEQALGSFAMANSLCYLDHAIAGTSTFYYFHTCGRPSKRVTVLMVAGLAALSIVPPHPLPGYAWLHSAWHFLASAAAVLWAVESHGDGGDDDDEGV